MSHVPGIPFSLTLVLSIHYSPCLCYSVDTIARDGRIRYSVWTAAAVVRVDAPTGVAQCCSGTIATAQYGLLVFIVTVRQGPTDQYEMEHASVVYPWRGRFGWLFEFVLQVSIRRDGINGDGHGRHRSIFVYRQPTQCEIRSVPMGRRTVVVRMLSMRVCCCGCHALAIASPLLTYALVRELYL